MRIGCTILIILIASAVVHAQQIKYKNLFYLLNAKNYEEAGPLLKEYLSDPKNFDECNPNLQMGFIYHDLADKTDILVASNKYLDYADSALIYYRRAAKNIDEKEIKKNDEYYHEYQRRDIRTGKFGIKLTDVQLDIENKIKVVEERRNQVRELQRYYTDTRNNYQDALVLFKKIKDDFPTEKRIYLRYNDDLKARLEELKKTSEVALRHYYSFEGLMSKIKNSGYNPILRLTEIVDYVRDGETEILLSKDNVLFWDFASWTDKVNKGYAEAVIPMRTALIEYDNYLNKLWKSTSKDSLSLSQRINPMTELLSSLRAYDDDPLPQYIFQYKQSKIRAQSFLMGHLTYRDSSDILYQINISNGLLGLYKDADSLINALNQRKLDEDYANYGHFVDSQFGTIQGLKSYLNGEKLLMAAKRNFYLKEVDYLARRKDWLIGANDSIPLLENIDRNKSRYLPLQLDEFLTYGYHIMDNNLLGLYYANINNARVQKDVIKAPLENEIFNTLNIEYIKDFEVEYADGFYILITMQLPDINDYATTVLKVNSLESKLEWSRYFLIPTAPKELRFNENTDKLFINLNVENYVGGEIISERVIMKGDGTLEQE